MTLYQENNPDVVALDLARNGLDDVGAAWISYLLQQNRTLQRVSLRGNDLGADHCLDLLAVGLTDHPKLAELDLSSNSVKSNHLAFFCNSLQRNMSLTTLRLQHIFSETILKSKRHHHGYYRSSENCYRLNSLGDALRVNRSISSLFLSNNNLADNDISHLFGSLEFNQALTILDLSDNMLSFEFELRVLQV